MKSEFLNPNSKPSYALMSTISGHVKAACPGAGQASCTINQRDALTDYQGIRAVPEGNNHCRMAQPDMVKEEAGTLH